MIAKILSTTASRFFAAIIGFLMVVINSRALGPEGVGLIGIILLNISIISTVSSIFAGPALVYFVPRKNFNALFIISFIASILGVAIITLSLILFGILNMDMNAIIPSGYLSHILFLSFLQSFLINNYNLLLGKERIFQHNLVSIIQIIVLFIVLVFQFYIMKNINVGAWLMAYYFSILASIFLVLIFLYRFLTLKSIFSSFSFALFFEVSKYGFIVQLASLAQLLNNRLPYYFLNLFFPQGNKLGVFTVGTQLSESILVFGKSISMVQYSKISNETNEDKNSFLTMQLLKFIVVLSILLVAVLLVLPVNFYVFLFGFKAFSGVKLVILGLSIGIIAMNSNMILSHFLSGIGKPIYNLQVSFVGLVVIFVFGYWLIPSYGLLGAAIATSISYLFSCILSLYLFLRISKYPISKLIISKKDIYEFIIYFKYFKF